MVKKIGLTFVLLFILISISYSEILFQDNFDDYSDSPSNHGWWYSSLTSVEENGGVNDSRCMKTSYQSDNSLGHLRHLLNRSEVYIRFNFKITNYNGAGGAKFIKLFGEMPANVWNNYSNTTIPMTYEHGAIEGVFYGPGMSLANDTVCKASFNLPINECGGNVEKSSSGFPVPEDEDWHTFEAYFKMNTDNNSDGEYRVWFDGQEYYHITGVKNRHNENIRNWRTMSLGDWCQGFEAPFEVWYDNVVVSDQHSSTPTPGDNEPPTISINNSISLSGVAGDDKGVSRVMYENITTVQSGTAIGNSNWSIPGLELAEGQNEIAVTAFDEEGLSTTENISITYTNN